jgi:predicted PurR-regulated permease PerM
MDIAILILVIVAVILLGIVTFFIFQIWVQSKETKLQLTTLVEDIKKSFVELESNHKKQSDSLSENIKHEFERTSSIINDLKGKIQSLENELKVSNEIVIEQIEKKTLNTENRLIEHLNRINRTQESKIDDQFSSLKLKIESSIQSLSDSVNLLRNNIENRIRKRLDC